eukprot:1924227-Amphidinium_carterae.1
MQFDLNISQTIFLKNRLLQPVPWQTPNPSGTKDEIGHGYLRLQEQFQQHGCHPTGLGIHQCSIHPLQPGMLKDARLANLQPSNTRKSSQKDSQRNPNNPQF